MNGEPIVMTPAKIYADFREHQYANPIRLPLPEKIDPQYQRIRANQWKLVDWEGDGDLDVIVGIGVWDDYGWDDAWDEQGNWKNGPLHGFVYLVENLALGRGAGGAGEGKKLADDQPWPEMLGPRPVFAEPVKITTTDGKPVDVYGMPSPNFADFDGDGDLDLICGEFLDGFTWFENVGTRERSEYAPGRRLEHDGESIHMELQMITPVAVDWDRDGDPDLIVGDEDGRVALVRHMGAVRDGIPQFLPPSYLHQEASDVKFGALVTPVSIDWDDDGDEDLVCGNTAGHIAFIENVGGGDVPKWDRPKLVQKPSEDWFTPVRHQAGDRGSIQGPCEAKWGYTTLSVADWNADGKADVIVNDIWGRIVVHVTDGIHEGGGTAHGGTPERPFHLRSSWKYFVVSEVVPVTVAWPDQPAKPAWTWWTPKVGELATQWRTTPCVLDWNGDGLNDLVMLDHEGYLAYFQREKRGDELVLLPPQRLFKIDGPCEFDQRHKPVGDNRDGLLRLNANRAGASGRRKLCFADWDGDGRLDLLVNSVNVNWLRNVRTDDEGFTWLHDEGPLDDRVLAGHTTSPTVVDWDQNGIPDLLVGAEDGHLYYKRNPRAAGTP
jgi:hypothetical protein